MISWFAPARYRSPSDADDAEISHVDVWDMLLFRESVKCGTPKNVITHKPVSYTHLDVYKRQVHA